MSSIGLFQRTSLTVGPYTLEGGRFDVQMCQRFARPALGEAWLIFTGRVSGDGAEASLSGLLVSDFECDWRLRPSPLAWNPVAAYVSREEHERARTLVHGLLEDRDVEGHLRVEARALGLSAPGDPRLWRAQLAALLPSG